MRQLKRAGSLCKQSLLLLICLSITLSSCGVPSHPVTSIQSGSIPLEDRLTNLVAFARLSGYIHYFHPSDGATTTKWEQFTERGIVEVENAISPADLLERLQALFQPIAPTVRIFITGTTPPALPSELIPPSWNGSVEVVAWYHHGFDGGLMKQSAYFSQRRRQPVENGALPVDMPDPAQPFLADLGGGISALIPRAVYAVDGATLPWKDPNHPKVPGSTVSQNGRLLHFATVILAWNVFQHFYPYFDVVGTDWLAVLRQTLTEAESAEDEIEFTNVLEKMVAQLQDGHGTVLKNGIQYYFPWKPPFGWDWIENQLIITSVGTEAAGKLHLGDRVISIDGQLTESILADREQYISGATPQWIRSKALLTLLTGPHDSKMSLVIQPLSGASFDISFKREVEVDEQDQFLFTEDRPVSAAELRPGIWYIDLTRVTTEEFNGKLDDLARAAGIIFDLRGYPTKINLDPLGHITDREIPWPLLKVPIIAHPDHENNSLESISQTVKPIAPLLAAKIAFITDGRAISYAESYLGIIEANKLADIVGGPTAGTNGNIAEFKLFGMYTFIFTGMVVQKLDGSPHHGVGVLPTVPVNRTIQGVSQGRDELLEKSILVVSGDKY